MLQKPVTAPPKIAILSDSLSVLVESYSHHSNDNVSDATKMQYVASKRHDGRIIIHFVSNNLTPASCPN